MPVQKFASGRQSGVRQNGEKLPGYLRVPAAEFFSPFRPGIPIIGQQFSRCPKFLFKSDQTVILQVGTAKIDTLSSRILTFLDKPPEKKRHGAETVKFMV